MLQFYSNKIIRFTPTDLNFSIKNSSSTENIAFYTVASACPLPNKFHKGLLLSSTPSLRVYFMYALLKNDSEFSVFLINELALNIINSFYYNTFNKICQDVFSRNFNEKTDELYSVITQYSYDIIRVKKFVTWLSKTLMNKSLNIV